MKKNVIITFVIGLMLLGIIYFFRPSAAKDVDTYDVILFWGQSNMQGYAGVYSSNNGKIGEDKKDVRLTSLGIDDFSDKSGIDRDIVSNYTLMKHVDVVVPDNTIYEYRYLDNKLINITKDTMTIGERIGVTLENGKPKFQKYTSGLFSLGPSAGTNLSQYFAKTYYEKTGHKVVIVLAANGGEQIAHFLPHSELLNYSFATDNTRDQYIYEAMVEKYQSAINYLKNNNMKIGKTFHVSMQGESDATYSSRRLESYNSAFSYSDNPLSNDSVFQNNFAKIYTEEVNRYYDIYNKVHNHLIKDLELDFGVLIETSSTIGSTRKFGILTVHEAQEKLAKDNTNLVLGSTYSFDTYVPVKKDYTGTEDYETIKSNSLLGVCVSEVTNANVIHFNAAGLSQIGKDSAISVINYLDSEYLTDIDSSLSESKIAKINDLNKSKRPIDSHASDTQNSSLEYNFREYNEFKNVVKIDGLGYSGDGVSDTDKKAYFSYPRMIKLSIPDKDGYQYILSYQNTQNKLWTEYANVRDMHNNGIDSYYTRSKDLVNWDKPKKLFESNYTNSKRHTATNGVDQTIYTYYGTNLFEYKDDDEIKIMAVSCKNALARFAIVNPVIFNSQGIFAKTSSDGGKTWSEERQIYTGPCWDPSGIQLDSGEIQVFMTHTAPIWYIQSRQAKSNPTGYFAANSGVHNSSGIAMISSLDNGKTWTPDIKGTTVKYDSANDNNSSYRNPYSAYRVEQEYVTYKENVDTVTNFNKFNFYGINNGGIYGILGGEKKIYQMGGGMSSPLLLNNKKRMILPSEATNMYVIKTSSCSDQTNGCANPALSISLAYSDLKSVDINGEKIEKYWLDLNNKSITYSSEKSIYDREGLALAEEGPVGLVKHVVERGAGPNVVQFPSGETILSYNSHLGLKMKIGSENATFQKTSDTSDYCSGKTFDKVNDIICVNKNSYWGSIMIADSHKLILTRAFKDNSTDGVISTSSFYLNHTIDMKNKKISSENDDALFIGSDSQAQMTLRANYDSDNVYMYVDWLDEENVTGDLIGLYINSDNLKYAGEKYNDLHIIMNKSGLTKVEMRKTGTTKSVTWNTVKAVVKEFNGSNVKENGSKLVITIPRRVFNLYDKNLKLYAVLQNKDSNSSTTRDEIPGVKVNNVSSWVKLRFVMDKMNINNYSIINNSNISNIGDNTTVTNYKKNFQSEDIFSIKIYSRLNKELGGSDTVYTGSITKISNANGIIDEYTNIVLGDVNGDGKITMADVAKTYSTFRGKLRVNEEWYIKAMDVNFDGDESASDVAKIYSHVKNGGKTSLVDVKKITLNKTNGTLLINKTVTLKATISPSTALYNKLTWTSSNSNIATVSSNGVVTGQKEGKAIITVMTPNGISANYKVIVK